MDLNDLNENLNTFESIKGLNYKHDNHNGILITSVPKYINNFFSQLKQFKDTNRFCDIQIQTKNDPTNTRINAHKIVLTSSSAYFRAQLAGGFKDENTNIILLDLNINLNILISIIDFIYTSQIHINDTNVQCLLQAAKLLQIDDIVNACCLYLYLNLDATNAIGIEDFAQTYGCMELAKQAQIYINNHFQEVCQNEEFFNLDPIRLCKLLHSDELNVNCETIVFKAVLDWVKYDIESRRPNLDRLFQCIRFYYVPPQFLKEQINNCDVIKYASKLKDNLQRTIEDLIAHRPCPYKNRNPSVSFALYIIGGYQRQSLDIVECFKCSTQAWEPCANMSYPRSGIACVSNAFYIYAIGGRNNTTAHGNIDCAEVECFDPFVNNWKSCASMSVARSRAAAGVIDGLIYVCGGASNSTYHSSVERYCPFLNRWELIAPMLMPRMGLGCVVNNRLLYAIGGYDGFNRLNQVECYNPDLNSWYFVTPMHVARSGAGACVLDNQIYVVGGYTTDLQLNSAERYDVMTNQWSFIANMSSSRSALSCVAWNSHVIALGGYSGRDFLTKVELYDPKEDKWCESDKMRMTSNRSGHGAAVSIELLP